ncbi:hypothetical protein RFI_24850 [Reticulomyxa filosa]|uniref:Exocyst complex component Sec8 n=1 Tax=Reticulomyxa filosa TaxID=46433 RepID=X6MHI3_RETFI|nr:hypothetical protein RFI_24850 [Reticulomyxa filosa]|eukprot:ETO12525.1 hypothetical protein RFI_24850 [Reticulomyxa filosa]
MSPFHVTALFRTVIKFVEKSEVILGIVSPDKDDKKDKDKEKESKDGKDKDKDKDKEKEKEVYNEKEKERDPDKDLRAYLNNLVRTNFIQEMQAHVSGELGMILLDDNQLDHTNELVVLPKSASRVYKLAEKVFTNFRQLPMFDPNAFVKITTQILTQCRKTYQWAFKFEVRPRLLSVSLVHPNKELAPEVLKDNREYIRNLSNYGLRKLLYTSSHEAIFKEKMAVVRSNNRDSAIEYKIFQELIGEYQKQWKNKADGGFAIFDMNVYSQLSLLCTGLYWISQKLRREQIIPYKTQAYNNYSDSGNARSSRSSLISRENVCEPIERYLTEEIEPLCEHYLAVIRVELRAQCVCYLSNIGNQSYVLHESSNKPQEFIIDLNKLLVKAEFELNECLPEYLVKFLFLELSYFICNILIQLIMNVQHKRINKLGAKQLWRNIFSLQQNLTTITQQPQEKAFERPQKFLDLSQKTPEEIEKFKKADNKMFKDYELEAIAKIAKLNLNQKMYVFCLVSFVSFFFCSLLKEVKACRLLELMLLFFLPSSLFVNVLFFFCFKKKQQRQLITTL